MGRLRLAGRPKSSDAYVPTGRIWPSGDFSVGYRRVTGDGDARLDLRSEKRRIDDGDYVLPDDWEYMGKGKVRQMVGSLSASQKAECDAWHGGAEGPLTLANASNSHTAATRPQRGLKGITGYGKKMVRSACTLIQRRTPKGRTTFATISMPTLPLEQRRKLAELWPEYVRQLLQFLTRQLVQSGLPLTICSVTEIQPKRFEDFGESYLHLHLVWPNRWAKRGNWAIDPRHVRAWSESFLQRNGLWNDEAWVRVNVQPVKKSAAGYCSKYMSKGVNEIAEMAEELGQGAIPRTWYNLTKAARDMVKAELLEGDHVGAAILATVEGIFKGVVPFRSVFYSLHEVVLEWDGQVKGVGWRGACLESWRQDIRGLALAS